MTTKNFVEFEEKSKVIKCQKGLRLNEPYGNIYRDAYQSLCSIKLGDANK